MASFTPHSVCAITVFVCLTHMGGTGKAHLKERCEVKKSDVRNITKVSSPNSRENDRYYKICKKVCEDELCCNSTLQIHEKDQTAIRRKTFVAVCYLTAEHPHVQILRILCNESCPYNSSSYQNTDSKLLLAVLLMIILVFILLIVLGMAWYYRIPFARYVLRRPLPTLPVQPVSYDRQYASVNVTGDTNNIADSDYEEIPEGVNPYETLPNPSDKAENPPTLMGFGENTTLPKVVVTAEMEVESSLSDEQPKEAVAERGNRGRTMAGGQDEPVSVTKMSTDDGRETNPTETEDIIALEGRPLSDSQHIYEDKIMTNEESATN